LFTKPGAARSTFAARVLNAVRRIPAGRVSTYGDIAALAGQPRAHRAVGNIMRECRDPGTPCHRVIAAGGALGGYGGNLQVKRELLRAEGIEVGERRVRGFADVRWATKTKATTATKTKATKIKRKTFF
jgi:O-6-methylguanine DNA methyltransferase